MLWVWDFMFGWLTASTAIHTRDTARNTAELVKVTLMTPEERLAYRRQCAARQRRRAIIILGLLILFIARYHK